MGVQVCSGSLNVNPGSTVTVSDGEFNGNLDLGNNEVSGGKFTDKTVAQHLKRGLAALFSAGKYAVTDEKTAKDDATYSVTNADGTVVYFTDAQSANDYAKESGAQAPKVLKVTVTFDSNQGTAVDSQLVAVGDKVAKPADPTRKSYVFSGWFTNEDCTTAYDFDAAVDGAEPEFTLYAGWKAETQPGAGENGGNGGNSSANANTNANTANSNSSNKGNLPQAGDSLTLVGSAFALVVDCPAAYVRHGARPQAARPLRNNRLVISAEVCERVHDGYHLAAEFGEAILDAGRILAIVMAKDQPVILHLPQAVGEHLLRDSLEVAAQLVETPGAHAQVADNEQLPLAADERHRRCDRTLRKILFRLHGRPTLLDHAGFKKDT